MAITLIINEIIIIKDIIDSDWKEAKILLIFKNEEMHYRRKRKYFINKW